MKRVSAAIVAVFAAACLVAGGVSAAPRQPQPFSCNGLGDIQILTPPAHGSDQNWGVAQMVGGGHLIPIQFRFSAFDNTVGVPIFDSGVVTKGGGNANHNQETTDCSFSQTATLADFLEPGDQPPPPPFSPTDSVTFTIDATVIVK
jgi:hypothetical protein